jgi:hypothetical protein
VDCKANSSGSPIRMQKRHSEGAPIRIEESLATVPNAHRTLCCAAASTCCWTNAYQKADAASHAHAVEDNLRSQCVEIGGATSGRAGRLLPRVHRPLPHQHQILARAHPRREMLHRDTNSSQDFQPCVSCITAAVLSTPPAHRTIERHVSHIPCR